MNLNCAILHADGEVVRRLEEYIGKVPFLSLRGTYDSPLEALRDYYEVKVEVYFIGICAAGEGGIGGMDFSRMLSLPTRVIFVADTGRYAAECFRLDALDYLTSNIMLPVVAIFVCIYVGHVLPKSFLRDEMTNHGTMRSAVMPAILFIIRYIAPLLIAAVLINKLLR